MKTKKRNEKWKERKTVQYFDVDVLFSSTGDGKFNESWELILTGGVINFKCL